jgi:hypothetical protein
VLEAKSLKLRENVRSWLYNSLNDPIVKTIAKGSSLTAIQLETLLIDVLSEHLASKPLKYDEKASFRLTKAKISRGAFNRTLAQAKGNVVKSIYTILLLGYLGIFESTALDPYLEVANKLRAYLEALKSSSTSIELSDEHLKVLKITRDEIERALKQLANPSEALT